MALAAGLGSALGAAGFAGYTKMNAPPPAPVAAKPSGQGAEEIKALRESMAQLRSSVKALSDSVATLRANADSAGKAAQAQLGKLGESIERIERAQAEPAARLARVAETVDRLERRQIVGNSGASTNPSNRDAPQPAAVATAAPQTAPIPVSAPAPAEAGAPQPAPGPAVDQRTGRPILEGWSVRRAMNGVALIEHRGNLAEVEIGDDIRGLGRVQDIRKQDGRWVVLTTKGLIVSTR